MTTTPQGSGLEVRLQLKPGATASRYVHGGWWPHGADPAEEFSGLIKAVASAVGAVSRVAYHLGAWGSVPRKLFVAGQQVRLEGFHTMRPHTVTLVGPDRRRTTLLVIPPDTPGGTARAILRTASSPDTTSSAEDILASNGIGGGRPASDPPSTN